MKRYFLQLMTRYRVVVCVGAILLVVEAGVRLSAPFLSGNIRHIQALPELVRQLETSPTGHGALVFIGNSLINRAVDTELLGTALTAFSGQRTEVYKITPDGTALADWYCLYNRYLHGSKTHPAIVVVGFAWAQLSDQYPVDAARLGGYFCTMADAGRLTAAGLHHEQLIEVLAGKIAHTYVNRDLIRNRLLAPLVPHYREQAQKLHQAADAPDREPVHGDIGRSYRLLADFARLIDAEGGRLLLIAMPVRNEYSIDAMLPVATRQLGVPLLDLRQLPGLDESMFVDPIHLNAAGRAVFSSHLAELLETSFGDHGVSARALPDPDASLLSYR